MGSVSSHTPPEMDYLHSTSRTSWGAFKSSARPKSTMLEALFREAYHRAVRRIGSTPNAEMLEVEVTVRWRQPAAVQPVPYPDDHGEWGRKAEANVARFIRDGDQPAKPREPWWAYVAIALYVLAVNALLAWAIVTEVINRAGWVIMLIFTAFIAVGFIRSVRRGRS